MRRARFIAEARHEFLSEIDHYNHAQPGLGLRFIAAVEEALAGSLVFPLAGSRFVADRGSFQVTDAAIAARDRAISPKPSSRNSSRSVPRRSRFGD